jgi:hypothetical protein
VTEAQRAANERQKLFIALFFYSKSTDDRPTDYPRMNIHFAVDDEVETNEQMLPLDIYYSRMHYRV